MMCRTNVLGCSRARNKNDSSGRPALRVKMFFQHFLRMNFTCIVIQLGQNTSVNAQRFGVTRNYWLPLGCLKPYGFWPSLHSSHFQLEKCTGTRQPKESRSMFRLHPSHRLIWGKKDLQKESKKVNISIYTASGLSFQIICSWCTQQCACTAREARETERERQEGREGDGFVTVTQFTSLNCK